MTGIRSGSSAAIRGTLLLSMLFLAELSARPMGLLFSACDHGEAKACLDRVIDHFIRSHNDFRDKKDVFGNYTLEITLESMLDYTVLTGDSTYLQMIRQIFERRDYRPGDTVSFEKLPFSNPYFSYDALHQQPEFIGPFVYESRRMKSENKRDAGGVICLQAKNGDCNMLIDYLQEYGSRMSKAGNLSGDTSFYRECVDQFRMYRDVLQDKQSGLYSQGRGWLENRDQVSPGAWSRGQGWLIRGMVTSLMYMPPDSYYFNELRAYLEELADGLIEIQDDDGMWHTLLHLPHSESYPETSGTGMIAGYLAIAYHKGILTDIKYRNAALKAVRALIPYIDNDGAVTYVSKGPGPLRSIEEYRKVGTDEHHGYQAVIYALTGMLLLEK